MNEKIDDGSLAFLNIAADQELKRFNCDLIRMADLINKEFWILDYFDDIKTKNGDDRYLVKIKYNLDSPDSEAKKFITTSQDICYKLRKIRELNAFPRRVTLKSNGKYCYIE